MFTRYTRTPECVSPTVPQPPPSCSDCAGRSSGASTGPGPRCPAPWTVRCSEPSPSPDRRWCCCRTARSLKMRKNAALCGPHNPPPALWPTVPHPSALSKAGGGPAKLLGTSSIFFMLSLFKHGNPDRFLMYIQVFFQLMEPHFVQPCDVFFLVALSV